MITGLRQTSDKRTEWASKKLNGWKQRTSDPEYESARVGARPRNEVEILLCVVIGSFWRWKHQKPFWCCIISLSISKHGTWVEDSNKRFVDNRSRCTKIDVAKCRSNSSFERFKLLWNVWWSMKTAWFFFCNGCLLQTDAGPLRQRTSARAKIWKFHQDLSRGLPTYERSLEHKETIQHHPVN